jgi:hypothetical protein
LFKLLISNIGVLASEISVQNNQLVSKENELFKLTQRAEKAETLLIQVCLLSFCVFFFSTFPFWIETGGIDGKR